MIRMMVALLLGAATAFGDTTAAPEQPIRMELAAGFVAELTWKNETEDDPGPGQATITGPGGVQHSFEVYGPGEVLSSYPIRHHDIDRDGTLEVLVPVGIGYGGVNVFYVILFWRGDSWWATSEIPNPEFTGRHKGLLVTAKSGPTYYRERWDMDDEGKLVLRIGQWATFAGFDVRYVMAPDGEVEAEMLVYETTDLFDEPTRVFGVVRDARLPLTATADSDEVSATLRIGMGAELLKYDENNWKVLLRAASGEVGWADPEGLLVDP